MRGAGGVVGTAWGVVEVMGTTQGAAEIDEAGDKGVARGQAT
jgi:hypothetical protein